LATFYTIGHSNRTITAFIALLLEAKVEIVADVRTIPKSRHNPQFNAEALAASLCEAGIGYTPMPALGGLRGRRKDAGPSPNRYWENESFRNYADYTATAAFRQGLDALLTRGRAHSCAIMCAEAVWWRCHRRIIADYLLAAGREVIHILGEGHLEHARIANAAMIGPDGVITYPGAQGDLLL
jgi:uncharacterized protein (DUF488 family)